MENILEEINQFETCKEKNRIKNNAFYTSNNNPVLKIISQKIKYNYSKCKYSIIIFLDAKLFAALKFFNPNFVFKKKFESPTKKAIELQDLKKKEQSSEKFELEFDEPERKISEFRDIALYMRREPNLIPKEGVHKIGS